MIIGIFIPRIIRNNDGMFWWLWYDP